jgi:hypothetical protein
MIKWLCFNSVTEEMLRQISDYLGLASFFLFCFSKDYLLNNHLHTCFENLAFPFKKSNSVLSIGVVIYSLNYISIFV